MRLKLRVWPAAGLSLAVYRCGRERTMGISQLKKDDDSKGASKTYIEFQSDGSEAEQEAYDLVRRGGHIREGVDSVDRLYAELTIHLSDALFEDDPTGLMEWLELDEDDWDAYQGG